MLVSLHFTCSTYCTRFPPSIQAKKLANCNDSTILSKIKHYFPPVCDISTFKRSFLSILHAEHSARIFHRRYRLRHTQITIIYPFCPKLTVISHRLRYLRRLHARFSPFSMQYVLHAFSTVDTSQETRKLQ